MEKYPILGLEPVPSKISTRETDQSLGKNNLSRSVLVEENLSQPNAVVMAQFFHVINDKLERFPDFACNCGDNSRCELCSVRIYMSKLAITLKPSVEKCLRLSLKQTDGSFMRNDVSFSEPGLRIYTKNYYVIKRRVTPCKYKVKKKSQTSSSLRFECDETTDSSDLLHSHCSVGSITTFTKDSSLTHLSDFRAEVKDKNYFAQKIADCGLVMALSEPNEAKYISHHRLAPQGVDWPECMNNRYIARRPLFVLLRSYKLSSAMEAVPPPLLTLVYLFDAILDCRISEKFNLDSEMIGVFRITDRWRELSKILLANEDQRKDEDSTTSLYKEVGAYLKGVYLVVEVSKRLQTQGSTARNGGLLSTSSKPTGMLAVTNINADNISEGDCHWTPIAWTAVHLSTAVVQMSQETQRSPRRRHFSVSERYLSAERREGQNQQITEAFRRPRLLSDAGDPLHLPLRSRTISDHRRFSSYASEGSPNGLQIREVTGSESTSLPLEDSLSSSSSSTDDLRDSSKMVELNLQLTTRNFFKKDLTTGNHSSEIERTIMEAFKLQSSTPNISPWIHDMLTRVGHAHPLRRLKTFSGQMEISMTGIIASPCGLSHHIQRANFRSTEGEDLLTNGSSETRFQEIVEFPTIGRVFPFNFPRNLLFIYPRSVTFGMSKGVSKNIEIVIQLWYSDADGNHLIPAFPDSSSSNILKNEVRTHVVPKTRSPEFTDEIKVLLPKRLNSSHHLLFTFIHIEISSACDTNESVLGYSWLPILINDQICSGEETLYLTHDQPTSKMAQTMPRHVETLTKDSMESGELNALIKTSFHLSVVPVSSLYQDDDCVASIIHACNFANFEEISGSLSEHDIFSTQSAFDSLSSPPPLLVHLQKAKLNYLVLYLVPIMDGLLQTLGVCLVQNKTKPSQNLLTLLAFYIYRISKGLSDWEEESTGRNHFICAYLSGIGRSSTDHVLPYLLSGYPMMGLSWFDDVSNYLRGSSEPVTRKLHEELLQCLIAQIATDTPFSRNFCEETLWFFLELLIRTLIVECKINAESASHAFVDSLDVFTREITKSILTRIRLDDNAETLDSTRLVNRAFAFFLQDLLTHLNATHVFRLISTYMQAINAFIEELLAISTENSREQLAEPSRNRMVQDLELLKLELLQIVTASPDYLLLSLPDPNLLPSAVHPINQPPYFTVAKHEGKTLSGPTYQRLHFLPAVLLGEIQNCLLHSGSLVQTNALNTLWYLMKSHESHSCAYQTERAPLSICDAAALYIPLLDIACGHVSAMYANWISALEKQERVFREVAKVSMLFGAHRISNDGASKRSGWVLSSMVDKERVKWMGRRFSLTSNRKGSVEHHPFCALSIPSQQLCTASLTSTKTWINALLPPIPSSMPSETTSVFNDCVTRLLLLETLWILHYADQQIILQWLVSGSTEQAHKLVDLLILALNYFEYPGSNEFPSQSTDECTKDIRKLDVSAVLSLNKWGNLRFHATSTSSITSRVQAKFLFLFATSVTCKTLDLLTSAFSRPLSGSHVAEEERDNEIISSHLILSIARAYIFGLSMSHCSKTFQLLSCGVSQLISKLRLIGAFLTKQKRFERRLYEVITLPLKKFPRYFLEGSSVTQFVLCRVLLPHCASPLKKIRTIANATVFHLFQECHRVRNHLYPVNSQMALALHAHIAANDLILDTSSSFSWFTRRLGVVTDCLSYLAEAPTNLYWHQLLTHLVYDRRIQSSHEGDPLFPTLAPPDIRILLASAHLPDCFQTLKEYAGSNLNRRGNLENNGNIGSVSFSGLHFVMGLISVHAPDAEFQTQLNATDILACLLRFNYLQRCHVGSQIVEKDDQISVIELLVDLASACRLLPELRQYWLLRLAEVHLFFKQPAEAAQALLHTLAIDVEQMVSRKSSSLFTVLSEGADLMARQLGSPNLLEESALELAVGLPATIPLPLTAERPLERTSATVVVRRFYGLIEIIAKCLHEANQFEQIPLICYWVLPILYSSGEQEYLHQVHELIRTSHVAEYEPARTHRLFSTYFRVGFYGSLFDDQNGKEFIYKEAPLTKLAEITTRLQEFYSRQLGGKRVEIIKSSGRIIVANLDESTAYLQITYVEPFFEEFELRKRKLEPERNYGIKRFVMVTPFTQAGPAHGSISEQYKRKVILTTSRCFPYLNLRLPIIDHKELVLHPIDVAIEDVAKRNQQLALALCMDPPDAKFLQLILQGCVSTTVNQGPLEVAAAFLTKQNSHSLPASNENTSTIAGESNAEQRNELRLCLKEFLRKSQEGVRMNRQLIGQDQKEYQRELEHNFAQIKQQLEPYLKPPMSYGDQIPA